MSISDRGAVSVVIPSVGRPTLDSAVRSAVHQHRVETNVIVVLDLPRGSIDVDGLKAIGATVLWTGGGRGGAHARNLGGDAAKSEWLAYLDDDDEWFPDKLWRQLMVAQEHGPNCVVSCRAVSQDASTGHAFGPIPAEPFDGHSELAEWLFRKRRLGITRNSIFAPSLLVPTALARSVRWDETLRRHQDWDFLLRLNALDGVRILQLSECLLRITTHAASSVSSAEDWSSSLSWIQRWQDRLTPEVYADFTAGQPLRYALSSRDIDGVRQCLRSIWKGRRLPSIRAIALGLSGLLPRQVMLSTAYRATRGRGGAR